MAFVQIAVVLVQASGNTLPVAPIAVANDDVVNIGGNSLGKYPRSSSAFSITIPFKLDGGQLSAYLP